MNGTKLTLITLVASAATLTPSIARAQGGPVEIGTAVAIGIEVLNNVKAAIAAYGDAIAYAKAKTDGPDSDDRAVDFDSDKDHGLDWHLDVKAEATGPNNVDDGEENPYSPGSSHDALAELHFESTGGQWKPGKSAHTDGGKQQEFWGWTFSAAEDDVGEGSGKTAAAAMAAFAADGSATDFCYGAAAQGPSDFGDVKKIDCKTGQRILPVVEDDPLGNGGSTVRQPSFYIKKAGVFLASTERFDFVDAGGDSVLIRPRFAPVIDLFHSYLGSCLAMLPTLRGLDSEMDTMVREFYDTRIDSTNWFLSESPAVLAELTIVGAALEFDSLYVERQGRLDTDLLFEYFDNAVTVVAPEHAQEGYVPNVLLTASVFSGQDLDGLIGAKFTIPSNGDPNGPENESLKGFLVLVEGDIDDAVALGINTDGHYVQTVADAAWDGVSSEVEFTLEGLAFHHETRMLISNGAQNQGGGFPGGGACCMPDGSCQDVQGAQQCNMIGGAYMGDNTQCATVPPCPTPRDAFAPTITGSRMMRVSPNPVRSENVRIELALDAADDVAVGVYDVTGRRIANIQSARLEAGIHAIAWDGRTDAGRRIVPGVYFVKLETTGNSFSQKLLVTR